VVPGARRGALMDRSVLITGGSGYFGTVLAARAVEQGDTVRVFDLNPPDRDGPAVEFVAGDVRDREALHAACNGVEVVLHNVAQVPLAKDRALFDAVNVVGTANLLVAARDAGVAKVVHTSSSAVFGIPDSNPVTEETPCRPTSLDGVSRSAASASSAALAEAPRATAIAAASSTAAATVASGSFVANAR